MSVITRQIWITRRMRIQPIEIVQGSQIGIELQMMDYDVPTGASAKAYAQGIHAKAIYKADCTVSGNTVSMVPESGFFVPGANKLQIEINGIIIPFSLEVNCEPRISDAGDPATPEKVTPLVERAETAALAAEQSQKAVEDLRTGLEANYPEIPVIKQDLEALAQAFYDLGLSVVDGKLCTEVVAE